MKLGLLLVGVLVGCGGGGGPRDDAGGERIDAGPSAAGEANIREALDCGTPLGIGTGGSPGELEVHQVDTETFPDALCNDGTAAVLYYRPWRGDAANERRWVISLRGGGGCGNAESCAARWCSCSEARDDRCMHTDIRTSFNLNNMSGGGSASADVGGVLTRDASRPNRFADYNHVQLIYCSSDAWRGNARAVELTTIHPITGEEVSYTIHFLGAQILDADLRILRQDGVGALAYTLDGGSEAMPDLDDATDVVIVGDSAGGAGVITNLDYIAELLREHNTNGARAPDIVGIIDAIVGPDLSRLEFDNSVGAPAITTYEQFVEASFDDPTNAGSRYDQSCLDHHEASGTQAVCTDNMHVIRHHVTTPFFVRMALRDRLISTGYYETGLEDPVLGAFDMEARVFAILTQRELSMFPSMQSTAEEGDAIAIAPGVFAPSCTDHDTIHTSTQVYDVTIDPDGDGGPREPVRFFDAYDAWRAGADPSESAVLSSDPTGADTHCPRM